MILVKLAVVFLAVALVAALFGFTGLSATAIGVAKALFFVFVALFIVALIVGLVFRI